MSYVLSGSSIVLGAVTLKEYGWMGFYVLSWFPASCWVIFATVALCVNVVRRRWRRSASIVAAPLIIALVGITAHLSGFSADEARLAVWKNSYLADLARLPEVAGGIRIKLWPWRNYPGGFIAGSPEETEVLVYDSSDQIILPRHVRSAEWFSSADIEGDGHSSFIYPELIDAKEASIKKIGCHFYILWIES